MALVLNAQDLTKEEKTQIIQDLVLYTENGDKIYPYTLEAKTLYLPLNYAFTKLHLQPDPNDYKKTEFKFNIQLRDYQIEAQEEILKLFQEQRTGVLSLPTGYGKSLTALSIMSKLGLKTCIVYHRDLILDAWQEEIDNRLIDCKYTIVQSDCLLFESYDVYLVSNIILGKLPYDFFSHIGFFIVDEAHCFFTQKNVEAMCHVQPLYSLALTATPDEKVSETEKGPEEILDLFFGEHRIEKEMWVPHDVYVYNTGMKPEIKKNKRGDLDWNAVLKSQAENVDRNQMIINMAKYFKDKNILIICKRVPQAKYLYEQLKEQKESVDKLYGSSIKKKGSKQKAFDTTCRVLVTTYSKSGVGFNHPNLNMLIVAGDVEAYFAQYFGRVTRRQDVRPMIIDLVDNFFPLQNHLETRLNYYRKVGGVVRNFDRSFPEFIAENVLMI